MTLDGFEMFFYTLAFVVPGFIMNFAYSIFIPHKNDQGQTTILRFIYFSCINYALWSWLFYIIIKSDYTKVHPLRTAGIWGIVILISPFIIGMIVGILSKKDVFRKALQRMGINPIHVIPTAWDYKFSRPESRWVLVTLQDDSIIAGVFGPESFCSSEAEQRDLYLEKVFKINEQGTWLPVDRDDGILIMGDQIKYIEFKN